MNLSKIVPLTVALVCITAIGVSATTLETSVSTDPDEAVDTYEVLPIGQDDAAALQQEFQGDEEDPTDSSDGDESPGNPSDNDQTAPSQGDDDDATSLSETTGVGAAEQSLLDRLLEFLLSILRFLLAVAAILGAGALAYRYRDRVLAALRGLLGPTGDAAADSTAGRSWPDGEPANAVERAWLALVQRVDPERPSVMTPAECAHAARRAGLDATAVETITGAFERVEYGGVPPSAEAERVEAAWREIDGSHPGDGSPTRGDGGAFGDHDHDHGRGDDGDGGSRGDGASGGSGSDSVGDDVGDERGNAGPGSRVDGRGGGR